MKFLVLNESKGGCAWWRGVGPWSDIAKMRSTHGVDVEFGDDFSWAQIRAAHGLFVLRPSSDKDLRMIKEAKWFGTKVWLDFDDDLLAVGPDNPAHPYFDRPKTKENIETALGLADYISFSTETLKLSMEKHCPNAKQFVIFNGYDPRMLHGRKPLPKGTVAPIVLWRGSNTHHRDLLQFEEGIVKCAEKFPKMVWLFLGAEPWFANRIKAKHSITEPLTVTRYFQTLASLNCQLGIVPLADTPFNRSKSNIAAMEIATTGGTPIVPDWPGWSEIDGAVKYASHDPIDFVAAFDLAYWGSERENYPQRALEYFKRSCSLRCANNKRLYILSEIMS